jgi:putative ABC transport system permease protein
VTGLLVALFLSAGIRCVLVDWESSPQYLRAVKATTSGPQAVDLTTSSGQKVNAAALRAVPGVEAVIPAQLVGIKCTANDPRNIGLAGTPSCGTAVVATCQQLRSLSPGATGCAEGKPAWLIFDPPRLFPPTDRVDLLGAKTAGLTLSGVELRLPVRSDPKDPGWADTPYDLVIPPATPGIEALIGQQEPDWRVILAGGRGTFERFRASAQQQGIEATSLEDTSVLDTVGRYRSGLYLVTVLVLCLGLIALLITSVDRAIEQRKHLAALAVIGVPPRVVRQSQWIQTLIPLVFGFPGAAGAGLLAGAAYLNLLGERQATPWPVVLSVTIAALVATLLVAAATSLGLGGRVRSVDLRQE